MYSLKSEGLTKRFGSRKVFSGIDFEVSPPGVLAIVGPNGSGKSTLLKTILGEYHPTRGKVTYEDVARDLGYDYVPAREALIL